MHKIVIDICTSLSDFKKKITGGTLKFQSLSQSISHNPSGIVKYFVTKAFDPDSGYCTAETNQFNHPRRPWYDFSSTLLDLFYFYIHNSLVHLKTETLKSDAGAFELDSFRGGDILDFSTDQNFFQSILDKYTPNLFVFGTLPIAMSSFLTTIFSNQESRSNVVHETLLVDIDDIYFPKMIKGVSREGKFFQ